MRLKQIFDTLKYTYLRDTAFFRDGVGIKEIDYPEVLISLNATLEDLHTRFPLKFDQVLVEMTEGQTDYILDSRFATSNKNSPEQDRWILDDDKPFEDNIRQIITVFSNLEEELPLNDSNNTNSVFTPEFNRIQVPDYLASTGYQLCVAFSCTAPQLEVSTTVNLDTTSVSLPNSFLNALVAGTASHMFHNIPALKGQMSKQQQYEAKYELECIKITNNGLVPENPAITGRIEKGGWV